MSRHQPGKFTRGGRQQEQGFRCLHCHLLVSTDSIFSGVRNRNHCPYCLWSRHVDSSQAGDRLATCQAQMKPIGLTFKSTRKKYGIDRYGELMLIHLCAGCGKVSINRIAADDAAEMILGVYQSSLQLEAQMRSQLAGEGIRALDATDREIVNIRLFGKGSKRGETLEQEDDHGVPPMRE
jgi:hypothetical protein